jgi:hypothetical protein
MLLQVGRRQGSTRRHRALFFPLQQESKLHSCRLLNTADADHRCRYRCRCGADADADADDAAAAEGVPDVFSPLGPAPAGLSMWLSTLFL